MALIRLIWGGTPNQPAIVLYKQISVPLPHCTEAEPILIVLASVLLQQRRQIVEKCYSTDGCRCFRFLDSISNDCRNINDCSGVKYFSVVSSSLFFASFASLHGLTCIICHRTAVRNIPHININGWFIGFSGDCNPFCRKLTKTLTNSILQTAMNYHTEIEKALNIQDFYKSCWRESDPWPPHYQCDALPTEPQQPDEKDILFVTEL